jgi:hypothetical protein
MVNNEELKSTLRTKKSCQWNYVKDYIAGKFSVQNQKIWILHDRFWHMADG